MTMRPIVFFELFLLGGNGKRPKTDEREKMKETANENRLCFFLLIHSNAAHSCFMRTSC